MNKFDLVTSISKKSGLAKYEVDRVIDAMPEAIIEGLLDDGEVKVKNLFAFEVYKKRDRVQYDVNAKEVREIKGKYAVRCKIGKQIEDMLKFE